MLFVYFVAQYRKIDRSPNLVFLIYFVDRKNHSESRAVVKGEYFKLILLKKIKNLLPKHFLQFRIIISNIPIYFI